MMKSMITVAEASALMEAVPLTKKIIQVPIAQSTGAILAEDLFAKIDIPAFNQSSVDGYAIRYDNQFSNNAYKIVTKIAAGNAAQHSIQPGESARIFTGAPVPEGADTIVMQEMTRIENDALHINYPQLQAFENFRPAGSEIKQGALALPKGTRMSPHTIGFLAGLGYDQVPVFASPTVALIITGNELQTPGQPLQHGQVYESSSYMLQAGLQQMGISHLQIFRAKDTLEEVTTQLNAALHAADIVMLTGGVSVGDYDFVVQAANNCGVTPIFHKVKQRPGKPLYFGTKGEKRVFGLPGNPSSVLTCFYIYVWPFIRAAQGQTTELKRLQAPLVNECNKKIQLTQFLKGTYIDGQVTILTGQESYRMASYAQSNCLVHLPETPNHYKTNDIVELIILPMYG
ncbi:molybdopterin molybdotransferase [Chitinophaga skermanii]|uniref:Molybdopterin molybdenumtransferase n=2 Tax=Chitinophaga skermanii TaxID=331697 RepID=A0A327Q0J8_9BACT|nr:molybdopterin molybdotransferase [Chitinophaga skermanii]